MSYTTGLCSLLVCNRVMLILNPYLVLMDVLLLFGYFQKGLGKLISGNSVLEHKH